jgi:hypothetical protein
LLIETCLLIPDEHASLFSCYALILVLFPIIPFNVAREELILVFSSFPSNALFPRVSAKVDRIYPENALFFNIFAAQYRDDDAPLQ